MYAISKYGRSSQGIPLVDGKNTPDKIDLGERKKSAGEVEQSYPVFFYNFSVFAELNYSDLCRMVSFGHFIQHLLSSSMNN